MTESDVVATPAATPKKAKSAKPKKPKTAPSHPKVSDMVNTALGTLKERNGSSVIAIKKYISSNYKVDAEKLAPFIKKYLKNAVASGSLVQTKGKGASGSFRSATQTKAPKVSKPKSTTTPKAKKAAKPAVAKKPAASKKPKAKAAKSPKKAKAPKPKASKAKKAKSAKKGKK